MKNNTARTNSRLTFLISMDWWVALGICFLIFFLIACIPLISWQESSVSIKVLSSLAVILFILYIIDLGFFTSYELTSKGLLIRSQMREFFFPYRNIKELRRGNITGLFSFGQRKRFSLSANNLFIIVSNAPWKIITLSPKNQQEFTNELLKKIDEERESRATIIKNKRNK